MHSDIDQTLAALADPTRRAVIDLLRDRPLRSGDLADALSTSRPSMSRHLRVLRKAGVVDEATLSDDARGRMYQFRPHPLTAFLRMMGLWWGDLMSALRQHGSNS